MELEKKLLVKMQTIEIDVADEQAIENAAKYVVDK